MTAPEQSPRQTIGRYLVVHGLGQGAMGEVLLARDPVLDRNVAIKYLRRDLDLLPEQRAGLVQRLWHEARASARLSHPNIVALHDMGEDPDLGPYLVFEYVEGPTLKERLTRGPLDPAAAARLSRELGDALGTAHASGVLHRDVKPENVILRRSGAKVADFGIARMPNSTLTRRGALLGTPAYSAPETLEGSQFSARSDQFSLAATLYEALSGRRAFPGDDALQVATKVRLDEPRPFAQELGLDVAVDQVLSRALSKNPAERFLDCAQFGAALCSALAPHEHLDLLHSLPARQDTMTALSVPVPRRRFTHAPTLIAAGVALAAGYFVLAPRGASSEANAYSQGSALSPEGTPATAQAEATRSNWVSAKPALNPEAEAPSLRTLAQPLLTRAKAKPSDVRVLAAKSQAGSTQGGAKKVGRSKTRRADATRSSAKGKPASGRAGGPALRPSPRALTVAGSAQ